MATQVEEKVEEFKVIEDVLKEMGEPVRLKDLVELTKDRVKWTDTSRSGQMQSFMRQLPTVEKVGYGLYQYLESKSESGENEISSNREDDNVLEVSDKDRELLDSFRKTAPPPMFSKPKKTHRIGDVIEGRVTGVEDYGVFVCNDDETMQGLVHITNVNKGIVDDLTRHFKIGDRVKARIMAIKKEGKLSLSTKEFELPDYFTNSDMVEKLKPIAERMNNVELAETKKVVTDEHREVYKFIQGMTGIVSEQAREKINELIEKGGMFKFTMALSEAQKDFEVDVSMILARAIEEKMSGVL